MGSSSSRKLRRNKHNEEVNRLQRDKRILTNCVDSNALTEQEVSSLFRYDVPEQEVSSLFRYDVLVLRWYSRHASLAVQEADPKTARDHRLLSRVADTITSWDEITTLGLELSCNPKDVARLRSKNRSIKGAACEILRSFYSRAIRSEKSMKATLREVLRELGKEALVLNLGLVDTNTDVT